MVTLNFYLYLWPFIHCLYFIYTRRFYVRARKNNATVEINPYRVDFCVHCSLFLSPIVPDWLDKS